MRIFYLKDARLTLCAPERLTMGASSPEVRCTVRMRPVLRVSPDVDIAISVEGGVDPLTRLVSTPDIGGGEGGDFLLSIVDRME